MAQREFDVEGMTSGHCEMSVQEEISEVAGVTSVNADHTTGKVTVEGDGYSTEDIEAAVKEAGYTLA
ncbi:transporter [Corynebacterium sp. zg912]|uniref:Heavy-metal-associated domain-containing protein n=1 Tax=Corynebacterium wankanglinii TaxID=2735136 RepID=A0A7H0K9T0_9CORY|nr:MULTISPECIES: heavy metal-associated domain-containing protein [Corynebacterium]MBA1838421.1 heavy-metal-associated domain-containing protein [Corynebacterium wankanglinii]MCR5929935.1 transporter [Corynebacterium sp. zg912]QNP94046.1 heavy-metal-associated domain-containing protein [Corynebacterium wankanglinii]